MERTATVKPSDRVSYGFGMKLSLPAKYESADFHVSLSSDVESGETSVQAFNRIKKEVETYAELAYQQIRNSEEGLHVEQSGNKKDVQPPAEAPKAIEAKEDKPKNIKILRQQIKAAFGVLEAQKKITKPEFVTKYLFNKKTDDLSELEVTKSIVALRENFPELKL